MARTVTTGGAISGYCAIGSTRIAARPAMVMKTEITAAKIGLSMKNRENIYLFCGGFWFSDLYRRSRPQFHDAVDDHLVAFLEARGDDPLVLRPLARLHRARVGGALLAHHVDELALRAVEHRALGHGDRVRMRRAAQHHAHERAGAQHAFGVGQL